MSEERRRPNAARWLSLGDASRFLGVSAATVRRWSDSGRLRPFTTPGGHRRFSRDSLERMLPSDRVRRPELGAGGGLTPTRLRRAYRRQAVPALRQATWIAALDVDTRETFRQLGRRLAWELVAHLDAFDDETRQQHLREATALAAEYGRLGADMGLAMSDVVEGFLAFRRPFLAEVGAVAARHGFAAAEVTALFEEAERALDRLLIATMSGHRIRVGSQGSLGSARLRDRHP